MALLDRDGNSYTTIVIGSQEWTVENHKCTKYADGSPINDPGTAATGALDWFLPSRDELYGMWEELHRWGYGSFAGTSLTNDRYWSSSEYNSLAVCSICFVDGSVIYSGKLESYRIRACRSYVSAYVYALREEGASGGLIFHIVDNGDATYTYWEAAPEDGPNKTWSSITNAEVGGTGFAYGDGVTNSNLIIAQYILYADDYFMPSKDELNAMYTELDAYGVGGFSTNNIYHSSSETTASHCWGQAFNNGAQLNYIDKDNLEYCRPVRSFTTTDFYELRDIGPGKGLIFHRIDNGGDYTYYEAAPTDKINGNGYYFPIPVVPGFDGTSTGIGEGANNTELIIAFITAQGWGSSNGYTSAVDCKAYKSDLSHTDSAAKYCLDFSNYVAATPAVEHQWWPNNDIGNKADYGALYDYTAITGDIAYLEKNGLHESDWRVPTKQDFDQLVAFLGGNILASIALKEAGTTRWDSPNTGTNTSGFTAVGGGIRTELGVFQYFKQRGVYWSNSIETPGYTSWILYLYYNNPGEVLYDDFETAYSVRLVRNYTTISDYGTGKMAAYTHYLTLGSSITQVYPLNFLESTLVDELEKDNVFYRRKYSGSLTFVNNNGDDDFDLLYAIETSAPYEKLLYEIYRNGALYWNGYFSTTDGKFDLDKCTFEVTPLPDDDYAAIFDKADIQYNILNIATVVTTHAISGPLNVTLNRNRWLYEVIQNLADGVKTGVATSSDFFTSATNYVTIADNKLLYLTIAQKSDIIRYGSADPATTAMMSWNELMDILWGMFQIRWDYDSVTDTINVEHISWWTHVGGLDLRTQLMSLASNKYAYLKEAMPKYEKFSFLESDDSNFVGTSIWYDSKAVDTNPDSNTKETSVNVTTDLEYILNNPESIADPGFVILCNYESGGDYYVEFIPGKYVNNIKLNMRLSWANLHNDYFRHNRVLIEGYMNEALTTFWTAQKTKIQECFAVVCPDDDYDPMDEITTELGETYFGGAKGRVKTSCFNTNWRDEI